MVGGFSRSVFLIFSSIWGKIEEGKVERGHDLFFKERPLFPKELNGGVRLGALRQIPKSIEMQAMLAACEVIEHRGGDGNGGAW